MIAPQRRCGQPLGPRRSVDALLELSCALKLSGRRRLDWRLSANAMPRLGDGPLEKRFARPLERARWFGPWGCLTASGRLGTPNQRGAGLTVVGPLVFPLAQLIMSAQSLHFGSAASCRWWPTGSPCRVEQAGSLSRTCENSGRLRPAVPPPTVLCKDVPWQHLACGVLQP